MSCACLVPKLASRRTKECVPKIIASSYLHPHCKCRFSTVTDKLLSVDLNVMSVHLSAFVDFVNIFIRYRSKQRTLELPAMATKMVSTTLFYQKRNFFCGTKISINFVNVCSSLHSLYFLNSIQVSFQVAV